MKVEETLKMAMQGSASHGVKWCTLREDNASSGSVLNEIGGFVPADLSPLVLKDGIVLDMQESAFISLFPDITNLAEKQSFESKLGCYFYLTDLNILDTLCNRLKNSGLNIVLSGVKKGETIETPDTDYWINLFIAYIVVNEKLCNYSETAVSKVKKALSVMPKATERINELQIYFNGHIDPKKEVVQNVAYSLLATNAVEVPDDLCKALVALFEKRGYKIKSVILNSGESIDYVKIEVFANYLNCMIDRLIFASVYNSRNTFQYNIGCYLCNDTLTAEYKWVRFPAYKISMVDMANIAHNNSFKSTIYIRGFENKELVVLLKDITSYSVEEMLKECNVGDGSDSVVLQQILQYS